MASGACGAGETAVAAVRTVRRGHSGLAGLLFGEVGQEEVGQNSRNASWPLLSSVKEPQIDTDETLICRDLGEREQQANPIEQG